MESILVSVLMTAYNREKYIAEAIESVLASSYNNFELIIVDDGSKDGTLQIAQSFEATDKRVKVYINEKNLGDYNNRNKAASYAKGKYIKYLDSDDLLYPWGLQVMVHCMEENPAAALGLVATVYTNKKLPVILSPEEAYKMYFFKNSVLTIGPSGTIIRKDVFERVCGFSGRNYIGDNELWLKIAQKHSVVLMHPNLILWREHEDQQIVMEKGDHEIEIIRHQLNIELLSSVDCPLSKSDAQIAIRNLRSIKCRSIIKCFIKGDFFETIQKKRKLNLRAADFVRALKRNNQVFIKTLSQL